MVGVYYHVVECIGYDVAISWHDVDDFKVVRTGLGLEQHDVHAVCYPCWADRGIHLCVGTNIGADVRV